MFKMYRNANHKNIIVMLLDTLRADDAYSRVAMPTLNALARSGTSYANAVSPGTWTASTHASLFTNRRVSAIKGVSRDFFEDGNNRIDPWMVKTKFLRPDTRTIASRMSSIGYHSVLFSNNPFITSFTNMASGFDRVYDIWMHSNVKYNKGLADKLSFIINGGASTREKMYKASASLTSLLPPPAMDALYRYLRQKLNDGVSKADGTYKLDRGASDTLKTMRKYLNYEYNYMPHFMFINLIEAHENYPILQKSGFVQDKWLYLSGVEELTEAISRKLHKAYLRRIKYLDSMLNRSIRLFKEQGLLDNATLVITSDHGQLFGEHGMLYHSMPPHEGVSKVPLVSVNFTNGRVDKFRESVVAPVSLTSLHDALLNIASGKEERLNGNMRSPQRVISEHTGIIEGWDEQLLRMLKNRTKSAALIYSAKQHYNRKATAIYKGDFKLIHNFGSSPDELYNVKKDPSERQNIMNSNRAMAHALLKGAIAV